jgi:hypothetical protein
MQVVGIVGKERLCPFILATKKQIATIGLDGKTTRPWMIARTGLIEVLATRSKMTLTGGVRIAAKCHVRYCQKEAYLVSLMPLTTVGRWQSLVGRSLGFQNSLKTYDGQS